MVKLKVKGSSIAETLVTLAVVTLCIAISGNIIVTALKDLNPKIRSDAWFELDRLAKSTIAQKDFTNETFLLSSMRIEKRVTDSEHSIYLKVLELTALNKSGMILAVYRQLIIVDPDGPQ